MITAIVGGGIGAGATMFAAFGVEVYRRRRRESKVRLALLKEMQAVEREGSDNDVFNSIKEAIKLAEKGNSPKNTFIDKTVYQNIGSDLSLLHQEEIDPVVEYYTLAELWINRVEAYREVMVADGFTPEMDLPRDNVEELKHLEKVRSRAISELQSNM
jgi:hypothetical protein